MLLHDVRRGSICGFRHWSMKDRCWKARCAVVIKKQWRPDGTKKTLCVDLGEGDWRSFLEPHVEKVRLIYLPAFEKTEAEARDFAEAFRGAASPEWMVLYAVADYARDTHEFGAPRVVIATRKPEKVA